MRNIFKGYFIVIIIFAGILSSCATVQNSADTTLEKNIKQVSNISRDHWGYMVRKYEDISYNTVRNTSDTEWEKDIKPVMHWMRNHWNYKFKKYGDYIFYISSRGIIKRNEITGESSCIVYDDCIDVMLIKDNNIYYSDYVLDNDRIAAEKGKIFSVDLNGNNKRLLCDVSEFVSDDNLITRQFLNIDSFYIYGDDIYIKSSIELYKYNMNTKEVSVSIDDIYDLVFIEDKIYYIDHALKSFSIYEYDMHTNEKKLILGDGQGKRGGTAKIDAELFDGVFLLDNELYYTRRIPYQLYKYNADGEDILIAEIPDNKYDVFSVYAGDDKIYYRIGNDFYEYTPENKETKKLIAVEKITSNDGNSEFIVVNDTLIYYEDENSENICYLKLDDE